MYMGNTTYSHTHAHKHAYSCMSGYTIVVHIQFNLMQEVCIHTNSCSLYYTGAHKATQQSNHLTTMVATMVALCALA